MSRVQKYELPKQAWCPLKCVYSDGGFCDEVRVNKGNGDATCHATPNKRMLEILIPWFDAEGGGMSNALYAALTDAKKEADELRADNARLKAELAALREGVETKIAEWDSNADGWLEEAQNPFGAPGLRERARKRCNTCRRFAEELHALVKGEAWLYRTCARVRDRTFDKLAYTEAELATLKKEVSALLEEYADIQDAGLLVCALHRALLKGE